MDGPIRGLVVDPGVSGEALHSGTKGQGGNRDGAVQLGQGARDGVWGWAGESLEGEKEEKEERGWNRESEMHFFSVWFILLGEGGSGGDW